MTNKLWFIKKEMNDVEIVDEYFKRMDVLSMLLMSFGEMDNLDNEAMKSVELLRNELYDMIHSIDYDKLESVRGLTQAEIPMNVEAAAYSIGIADFTKKKREMGNLSDDIEKFMLMCSNVIKKMDVGISRTDLNSGEEKSQLIRDEREKLIELTYDCKILAIRLEGIEGDELGELEKKRAEKNLWQSMDLMDKMIAKFERYNKR